MGMLSKVEYQVIFAEYQVIFVDYQVVLAENKVLHDILEMCDIRYCKVQNRNQRYFYCCLLYTSDAADE